MLNLFGRTKVKHPTNPRYHYFEGRDFIPGGAGWVFVPEFLDPVVPMAGSGVIAGSMRVTAKPAIAYAPISPVQPMPTTVGDFYTQPAYKKNGGAQ